MLLRALVQQAQPRCAAGVSTSTVLLLRCTAPRGPFACPQRRWFGDKGTGSGSSERKQAPKGSFFGNSAPGVHKKGKSRITMQDRESAAEDSYRRVNKRETSSMSHGVRRSAEESKENMSGRSVYEEIRGPTGQTTEHPYPVSPFYPRIADNETPTQKRVQKKSLGQFASTGRKVIAAIVSIMGGVVFYLYNVGWRSSDTMQIPLGPYSMQAHKSSLQIDKVIYLDVAIDGAPVGTIHIGLFHRDCPRFCENIHRLATGNNEGRRTLKETIFWKATGSGLYGGDTKGTGKDGIIAEGTRLAEDRHNNFSFPFGCYANGAFTYQASGMNDSNFFISLNEGRAAVTGDYSCWGMVIKGHGVVEKVAALPRQPFPYFLSRVTVAGCGESELSGDREAIDDLLQKFHSARVKRFLATSHIHRENYQAMRFERTRVERVRSKRAVIEEELEETRVSNQALAADA